MIPKVEVVGEKPTFKFVIGIIVLIVILLALFGAFYTVPAGHRGILLTFGRPSTDAKQEGLGFKIPFAQRVVDMEVRTQKSEVLADSSSADLQDVQTTIALNYHVSPKYASKLYTKVGMDYKERIILPAMQESVKAGSAKYKAEELISKRGQVRDDIKNLLSEHLKKYYIVVDDFNIVNFQFSEEFDKAIEAKVTAEQLKLKAERDLQRIEIEKQQKITQAEAEAEALRLQKAVISPELIQLRQIEMQMMAIEKWNGVMPEATSGMPFIDVTPAKLE
ncbi:MAG: prohibitin family protein [Nanoarchaeota archaeon]|nr:prohibitin family protein [Nanoarchaeota archaeon]